MSSCAIIPFYNEINFLAKIIEDVAIYVDHIIAIDDGSTDESAESIKNKDNITIIRHTRNLGKGRALISGFMEASTLPYENIITIDADLQHDPKFIPKFIKKLSNSDIVLGNRLEDISSMPFPRIMSNKLTSFLISKKTGINIKDSQCGFRAYKKSILNSVIPTYSGFEAESEILILASKHRLKIEHVNISTIYGNEESKMRNLEAIKGFLRVIFSN